eukprot:11464356-Karenia_brevis.AAC.1
MDEQNAAYESRFKAVESEVSQLNVTVAGHTEQLAAQASRNTQFQEAIAKLLAQCSTFAGQLSQVQATIEQQRVLQARAATDAESQATQ